MAFVVLLLAWISFQTMSAENLAALKALIDITFLRKDRDGTGTEELIWVLTTQHHFTEHARDI